MFNNNPSNPNDLRAPSINNEEAVVMTSQGDMVIQI
jgi:hypothetical protein